MRPEEHLSPHLLCMSEDIRQQVGSGLWHIRLNILLRLKVLRAQGMIQLNDEGAEEL